MADLFKEVIPSIYQTKENVLTTEDDVKDYNPFLVNRTLSYHMDCILYANEMNIHHHVDKKLQYEYLLNTVRSRKRPFQKWVKPESNEDIQIIKEYFGYSNSKAKDALSILNDEQINAIRIITNKGGVVKK